MEPEPSFAEDSGAAAGPPTAGDASPLESHAPEQHAVPAPSHRREYPGLLRHHRPLLDVLMLGLLGVGFVGWACRWHVLHEVLFQIKTSRLRDRVAREVSPFLCETLLHDPSTPRRLRAAILLGVSRESPPPSRGGDVWNALFEAIGDADRKVAEAAWESLYGRRSRSSDREPGLTFWMVHLSVPRCVDGLSRCKSPTVRKELLAKLKGMDAPAYWGTARWALRSLDDPEAVDEILEDARNVLYERGRANRRSPHWEEMRACIEAGLESQNARIRDRCRRLYLDYLYDRRNPNRGLFEWVRSTRDIDTLLRLIFLLQRDAEMNASDLVPALQDRIRTETDYGNAVQLSVTVVNVVGEEREREVLRAGLENPASRIREYFEQILTPPADGVEPLTEPDDDR